MIIKISNLLIILLTFFLLLSFDSLFSQDTKGKVSDEKYDSFNLSLKLLKNYYNNESLNFNTNGWSHHVTNARFIDPTSYNIVDKNINLGFSLELEKNFSKTFSALVSFDYFKSNLSSNIHYDMINSDSYRDFFYKISQEQIFLPFSIKMKTNKINNFISFFLKTGYGILIYSDIESYYNQTLFDEYDKTFINIHSIDDVITVKGQNTFFTVGFGIEFYNIIIEFNSIALNQELYEDYGYCLAKEWKLGEISDFKGLFNIEYDLLQINIGYTFY